MSGEISAFNQTRITRALKGARKAGRQVTHVRLFADDAIELELADDIPMSEADLLAALEARKREVK